MHYYLRKNIIVGAAGTPCANYNPSGLGFAVQKILQGKNKNYLWSRFELAPLLK